MDGSFFYLDLQMSHLRVFYQFAGWEEATLMVISHISEKNQKWLSKCLSSSVVSHFSPTLDFDVTRES